MEQLFTKVANKVAHAAGKPVTFVACCLVVVVWAVSGPIFGFSDTWQLIINTGTTIITFLMVFLIQNSQNRDGAAIQAKLDEIIRSAAEARSAFVGIEHLTDDEIALVTAALEREVLQVSKGEPDNDEPTVEELLENCRDPEIDPPAGVPAAQ